MARSPTRRRVLFSAALVCAAALAFSATRLRADAVYDAVNDFSISSGNPNGQWSYGTLSSFTGGAFTAFTTPASNAEEIPGAYLWSNDEGIPYAAAVIQNASGSTARYNTIVQPTNLLNLAVQDNIVAVRWTAPTSGTYDVEGLLQSIDVYSNPVIVGIIEGGTTQLLSQTFNAYGNQASYGGILSLTAGTTLDFAAGIGNGGYTYLSTGLSATITPLSEPVPEPSVAIGLCTSLLGLGVVYLWRRRAKA